MKFIVIGISDAPEPFFTPEIQEIIKSGQVFSGGKRHHEIVASLLPADAQWIDITTPLDAVFKQYQSLTSDIIVFASGDPLFFGISSSSPVAIPCSLALPTPSNGKCQRQRSHYTPPSTPYSC